MKNWKFIKTGNAEYGSTEDIKSHLDTDLYDIHQKLKDKNALTFAYVYELQKKGWDISTISKNNKFIGQVIEKLKAGNSKAGNGIEISGVIGKLPPDSEISKTIYEELKKNNYDKDKTVLSLSIKYKVMPNARMFFEDAVEKVIKSYKNRTVNESIDKQVWSMFKGLTKDAEKEVGNTDLPTEQDLKNWIRMMEQDKREAQREMDKWKHHTEGQYSGDQFNTAMVKYNEAVSQIKKMQEELRQGKYKKVGNKVIAGDYYDVVMSGSHFYIYKNGGSQIIGPFNSEQEAQKKIDAIENERQKTGNAIPGSIASIGPAWMYGGTVYGKMDTDESGKKHNEYVKITWLGSDKGGVANYFIDDKMQSDKFGSLDKNELKRWAEQKIGNETLCQWAKAKPRIINGTWEEPRKMPFQEKSLRYAYEKAKSKGLSGKKLEDEMLRIVSTTPHESSANEQEKRNDVNKWILRNGVSSDFVNNLKRARNAMVKNAMSVSDLERRIKENEKYIRSLQGKTVDGDGWPAKDAIQEAQDEIDMMKSRIAELTNQGNKKVGNLDHVEEGDYVSVRYQGEIVDGVVRKIQGTQALVTIDNTDVWFPIRSLKEST